jgi:hypothetical protein
MTSAREPTKGPTKEKRWLLAFKRNLSYKFFFNFRPENTTIEEKQNKEA